MKPISAVEQFHALSLEFGPPVDMMPTVVTKPKTSAFFVFGLITLAYVCCEFLYNRALLGIASGTPTTDAMDVIEWIGRTMAGVGCALMIWRSHMERRGLFEKFSGKGFAVCVALSIPSMWLVQEIVIQAIVKNAEPSTLRAASHAMAGRQALLRPSSLSSTQTSPASEEERREQERAREACHQSLPWTQSPSLSSNTKTLWALFGVMAMNEASIQKNLRDATIAAAKCFVEQTPATTKRQHAFYAEETAAFSKMKEQYETASSQVAAYEKTRWASKSRTEAMWRSNANKFFGFDTTIPWGLSSAAFDRHPDVARLVGAASGIGAPIALGLDLDGFRKGLVDAVSSTFEASSLAFADGGLQHKQGEEAYKAALVPLIGLSLSLFFGFFNAAMLAMSSIAYLAKRSLKWWPSLAVALTIACVPLISSQPLAHAAKYKESMQSAWKLRPMMAVFLAWTVPAEAMIE